MGVIIQSWQAKELYILPVTETFAQEPKFEKLLRCCMSVTASLMHLGALLRDNLQMGAFS